MQFSLRALLFCVVVAGCVTYGPTLRTRAAFELDCPESSLRIINLGHDTRGVEGCGRRATYMLVDGRWVANTMTGDGR